MWSYISVPPPPICIHGVQREDLPLAFIRSMLYPPTPARSALFFKIFSRTHIKTR